MNKKALSLPILISLVVGNMIGTGIYVLPASLALYGSLSLIAWIYTSIGAIFLALTFANLNKRFPKTGGPYVYCKEAYGKLTGFLVAYTYWISNLVSICALAVASVGYLGFLTPLLDANKTAFSQPLALLLELSIVWLFTLINIIGIHTAGVVQFVLTIIKLIPLFLICFFGLPEIHLDHFTFHALTGESHLSAIASAAALTFWAFIGLESATIPAENTRGYRDVYKATIYGTIITSFIYILSTFVLMGMITPASLKNSQFPFAEASTLLFGAKTAIFIVLCAVISGLGSLNVCILIQGQIVFAAARDRLFPRLFAKLSKHDVPIAAQILSSFLVTLFLIVSIEPTLLKQFNNIALLAGLLTLLVYLATTLAEIKFVLASQMEFHKKLFNKSLLLPVCAVLYALWMISCFKNKMILITGILILFCIPIYFFTVKKNVEPIEE